MNNAWLGPRSVARRWLAGALAAAALLLSGCGNQYSSDTPDAVFVAAKKMIENGEAQRLPDLIYADSKEMRQLLDQIGNTLGSLQDLATAVQKAYPEEIQKLTEGATAAAKEGRASSYIQQAMAQMSVNQAGGRRRRTIDIEQGAPEEMRKLFDNALKELFADPYGWIAKSEGRLTTQTVSDDRAAILWDGKPVFGIGMMMRKDQGRWYVELPTYAPGVSRIIPKTEEGWEIIGGLFQVFENAFDDLAKDVKRGRCRRLDDLASSAGEKMFLPAVMVVFAYGQFMDAERKAARQAAAATAGTGAPGKPSDSPVKVEIKIGADAKPEGAPK